MKRRDQKTITNSIFRSIAALTAALLLSVLMLAAGAGLKTARADQLNLTVTTSYGADLARLTDGTFGVWHEDGSFAYYNMDNETSRLDPGTEIEIKADGKIDSLYIEWYYPPDEWTLRVNGQDYICGSNGYIQEYVKIPEEQGDTDTLTMILGENMEQIINIYAFSEGPLPEFVHIWNDPWDEADVLLISTHADDEILFFGGIIPTYADRGNVRIQLAYFSDFFQSEPYRSQEILNGLWTMGVTHYPQMGEFYDYYSEDYETAVDQFDHDSSLEYIVRTIRRFKPQVVIGQDPINGEYGHGGHMWCARMIQEAVEITDDPQQFPDSAAQYGTFDVPKVYFHLYPEKQIVMDSNVPLASFGGKTALEVAELAYDQHYSQDWTWFYVSDDYDPNNIKVLNCTVFGLYRTLVGEDYSGNDILDNITVYDEQQGIVTNETGERLDPQQALDRRLEEFRQRVEDSKKITAEPGGKNLLYIVGGIVLGAFLLMIIIDILVVNGSRSRQRKRERMILDYMHRGPDWYGEES